MTQFQILENYLHSQEMDATLAVTDTLLRIAGACEGISKLVARGPLPGCLDAARGDDRELTVQKELDQVANSCLIAALQATPVAYLVSEQLDQAMPMQESAPLSVAIAPLNGSSGLEANAAPGTIFSIYATAGAESSSIHDVVCQRGVNQVAAGYCIYGPQTSLVLTLGAGTHIFTLDPDRRRFHLTASTVRIAETTKGLVNKLHNFSHRKSDARGVTSLVAECHRILAHGGVFPYPGGPRNGDTAGRFSLLCQCNPIAFLVEQAGGGATTGWERILELKPGNIHHREPMIFGSSRELGGIQRLCAEPDLAGGRSPLFNNRGLFRA